MEETKLLLSHTISILVRAQEHYTSVANDDKALMPALLDAGGKIPLITEALQDFETHLHGLEISGVGSLTSTLQACYSKAQLSKDMLRRLSQIMGTLQRVDFYETANRSGGRGGTLGSLVIGMMTDVRCLIEDSALEETMRPQVKGLNEAIESSSRMEPSVQKEQQGHIFSNNGPSNQFNAPGGTQSNNTGAGNQFSGATFSGSVTFGKA